MDSFGAISFDLLSLAVLLLGEYRRARKPKIRAQIKKKMQMIQVNAMFDIKGYPIRNAPADIDNSPRRNFTRLLLYLRWVGEERYDPIETTEPLSQTTRPIVLQTPEIIIELN